MACPAPSWKAGPASFPNELWTDWKPYNAGSAKKNGNLELAAGLQALQMYTLPKGIGDCDEVAEFLEEYWSRLFSDCPK